MGWPCCRLDGEVDWTKVVGDEVALLLCERLNSGILLGMSIELDGGKVRGGSMAPEGRNESNGSLDMAVGVSILLSALCFSVFCGLWSVSEGFAWLD